MDKKTRYFDFANFPPQCPGIPDAMREEAWTALASRWRDQGPNDPYVELLAEPCIYLHAIKIDLRTCD